MSGTDKLEARMNTCEVEVLDLRAKVADLERRYLDMQNELSLLTSVQKSLFDQEKRLTTLEKPPEKVTRVIAVSTASIFVPFGSLESLEGHISSMFDCRTGDPRACHTEYTKGLHAVQRPYTVLGAIAAGEDAQEILRQELYTALLKLKASCKSERPRLYWRRRLEEHRCDDTGRYKLTLRIAIPEADFSVVGDWVTPDGVSYATLSSERLLQ